MYLSHLECPKCDTTYESEQRLQLCRCGSPLLVRYDLKKVKKNFRKKALASRKESLWRYWELLPIHNEENIVSLGEGMTPLIPLKKLGPKLDLYHLYLKDEGLIPTGTFKARGAAVGVSRAKELGIKILAMPTNGNAGSSWAAYCAKAGIKAVIVMPKDAPMINHKEVAVTGAELYLVNGLISDDGKIVGRAIAEYGWYDASTLKEPYRIEGKKMMGLEIVVQLGWEVPDVIIYPTGGGVGIIGIYKGLKELREINWIGEKMPRLVSVQEGSCYAFREAKPFVMISTKSRVEELIEFSQRMGYQKLGMAFCGGLTHEASILSEILEKNGFEVIAVSCKVGGVPKENIGVKNEEKIRVGKFEPMCNPISQAKFLNQAKTDFNIMLGLCIGHDSLFLKYIEGLTTVFAVKDRVTGHNPMAALYTYRSYYQKLMKMEFGSVEEMKSRLVSGRSKEEKP